LQERLEIEEKILPPDTKALFTSLAYKYFTVQERKLNTNEGENFYG